MFESLFNFENLIACAYKCITELNELLIRIEKDSELFFFAFMKVVAIIRGLHSSKIKPGTNVQRLIYSFNVKFFFQLL